MNNLAPKPLLALLDALTALAAEPDLPNLFRQILQSAVALLDADAGQLLLPADPALRLQLPAEGFEASHTAINKALSSRTAILWNQGGEEELDVSRSILAHQLTSILVAPFGAGGYLYLQRRERDQPFHQGDREVFAKLVELCARLVASQRNLDGLRAENSDLRAVQDRAGLVYACPAMEKIVNLAVKVASAPVPVVIHGETGTGKEVFARFIHRSGPRAAKPFMAVNCGAIPATLIESILFGHVKGAFTGASDTRKGLFEDADGGTLFLDEIAELPLDMQVKLLRALQEKKVTRVGDNKEIAVDVRILSASHRDLQQQVKAGAFREDLYFRLNVMQIELPSLRERGQDVLILARRFLERYAAEFGMGAAVFSKASEKALLRYGWPGNVRELENRVQKGLVQCEGSILQPADLGLEIDSASQQQGPRTLAAAREEADRVCIDRALRDSEGNLTLAGQILGIDRKVLREHMERLCLDKEGYKKNA